jgi:hypothetical protein
MLRMYPLLHSYHPRTVPALVERARKLWVGQLKSGTNSGTAAQICKQLLLSECVPGSKYGSYDMFPLC